VVFCFRSSEGQLITTKVVKGRYGEMTMKIVGDISHSGKIPVIGKHEINDANNKYACIVSSM
jgi:hypothetical protein